LGWAEVRAELPGTSGAARLRPPLRSALAPPQPPPCARAPSCPAAWGPRRQRLGRRPSAPRAAAETRPRSQPRPPRSPRHRPKPAPARRGPRRRAEPRRARRRGSHCRPGSHCCRPPFRPPPNAAQPPGGEHFARPPSYTVADSAFQIYRLRLIIGTLILFCIHSKLDTIHTGSTDWPPTAIYSSAHPCNAAGAPTADRPARAPGPAVTGVMARKSARTRPVPGRRVPPKSAGILLEFARKGGVRPPPRTRPVGHANQARFSP
jgi:hypothetical protein